MNQKTIRNIPQGEYFKRKPDAKTVYVRNEYCRQTRRYICTSFEDINRSILLKAETPVYIGFTF